MCPVSDHGRVGKGGSGCGWDALWGFIGILTAAALLLADQFLRLEAWPPNLAIGGLFAAGIVVALVIPSWAFLVGLGVGWFGAIALLLFGLAGMYGGSPGNALLPVLEAGSPLPAGLIVGRVVRAFFV